MSIFELQVNLFSTSLRRTALAAACCLLAACAGYSAYEEGRRQLMDGDSVNGLANLEKAAKASPDNRVYQQAYERERKEYVERLVAEGDMFRASGELDRAEADYVRARGYDPRNARVIAGIASIEQKRKNIAIVRAARAQVDTGALDKADAELRKVLAEDPDLREARDLLARISDKRVAEAAATPPSTLKTAFSKPITLEFRDASLKSVFEVISRTSGINFVFDRDVRGDTKINIVVRNSTLDDVVKLILTTNQLDRKLLNDNSVLVYPGTPAKQKEYRELVVRSFYLANADVKQAVNLVKGMVKTQDVFIDEKLNLMVVKDTPEAMSVVDKLVRSLDLAEPEVMLELEVLEVSRTKLQTLGIQYPQSVSFGSPALATGDPNTGAAAANVRLSGSLVAFTANPPFIINLLGQDSDGKVLANPRIRVKNREKAKVHIGSRVPVVTTTSTANVGVSSSVSYLDVGLKLDVEPNIYLRDEVAIKVGLEVSNITRTLDIEGTRAYELGTRNTATTLQIRDGETQILAGLINDEDRVSANKIPGLGDIPIIGRLFSSQTDDRRKTEIVLLITPRIVRNINWPQSAVVDTPVGTDAQIGTPPLRIAPTPPGALALAPSQGEGGGVSGRLPTVRQVAPEMDDVPPAEPLAGLLLAAPLSARPGTEVMVSLGLPPGTPAVSARLELAYDPAQLEPIGAAVSAPGRLPVKVDGAASVRFKILAQQGRAQIRAENLLGLDPGGGTVPMLAPIPLDIAITP